MHTPQSQEDVQEDGHKGTRQKNQIKYEARSNHAVARRLKIMPIHLKVSMARLQMFQAIVKDQQHHELYLASLFGPYAFEEKAETNIYLESLYRDIMLLRQFDAMIDTCEYLQEKYTDVKAQCLRELIESQSEHRQAFIDYDLKELTAASLTSMTLPTVPTQYMHKEKQQHEQKWICGVVMDSGDICGKTFTTACGLRKHMKNAKGIKGHPIDDSHNVANIVPSNMCPFCETKLGTRLIAMQHVANAIKKDTAKQNSNMLNMRSWNHYFYNDTSVNIMLPIY